MMNRIFSIGVFAFMLLAMVAFKPADQNEDLDFTLVNKTGYDIKDLFISPNASKDWGDDVLKGGDLKNGASTKIIFHPKATAKLWDISVGWVGYDPTNDVYWEGLDLTKYETITLLYNESTGKTSAKLE